MKFPPYGKLRWRKNLGVLCLFAMCWLVSSCVIEPLPSLRCYPCKTKCIEDQKLICVQGLCVPESNPDPKQCVGYYEGGDEKTEATAEMNPEESSNPEESVSPEDGAPIEQEPIREDGPELEIKETDKPYIERVNGNGSQLPVNAAASPSKIDNLPAAPTKPSPSRIKDALVIEGNLLNQIDRWVLQSKDARNSEQTWANQQIQKDSDMKHTLSLLGRNLVAGAFLLLGYTANTQVVSADVFILQGEPGVKGDIGDNKFTDNDATLLKALLTKLQANGDNLDITANTVTFKSATAQKFTLDLGNNATIKSGNATLDFAGDTITAKATTFSIDATTKLSLKSPDVVVDSNLFEVKGANATSLKLDDTARSIALRVTQKNSNPSTQATFSLEGGDANTSPAPPTKYPLAIFNRTNVQVQSGASTTNAAVNGLGNLIVGYNEIRANPPPDSGYTRTGSHNLVLGSQNGYASFGGLVAGYQNVIVGDYASVAGGQTNRAFANYSSVSGGTGNRAGDPANKALHAHAYVCGGNSAVSVTSGGVSCTNVP